MDEKLKALLDKGDYDSIADSLKGKETADVIAFLKELNSEQLTFTVRTLKSSALAEAFIELPREVQEKIISGLRDAELKNLMDEVSVEDTAGIIEHLPLKATRRIAEEDEILRLLEERKFSVLKPILSEKNPADLAALLEEVPEIDIPLIFRLLPKELASDTFVEMDSDLKEELIKSLNDKELKAVMDELFMDDTVDLIEEMPANVVRRIIAQSDSNTRRYINELLKYPKDSAGSIMTIEFVSLKPTMTVNDAFARIRSTGIDKETIYSCYVTDEKNKLVGIVSVKDLLLAAPNVLIGDIMTESVIYVNTLADKEEVANKISKYGFLAMPVTDGEKRLVGIVTVDDAMQVLQDESSEDIAKISAVIPNDRPYLKTSPFQLWKARVPWLLLLMLSATFTSLIISANSDILSMPIYGIILTASMPMIMGTGGNAGNQASATIIRAIALDEVSFKDFFKIVLKEAAAAVLLGLTIAVACFGKLMAVDKLWSYQRGASVTASICLSIFCSIVMAKVIGAALPLIAKKAKLDPAVIAGPFMTTMTDALSLLVYCGISYLFLFIF